MQALQTPRFKLPLLATGQAKKEIFHNEALTLLDFLVCPAVIASHEDPSTLQPSEGDGWLVGSNPLGDWISRADQVAIWSAGGWRFVEPFENLELFLINSHQKAVFQENVWVFHGTIAKPEGGAVVDLEARAVIDSILDLLRIKAVTSG